MIVLNSQTPRGGSVRDPERYRSLPLWLAVTFAALSATACGGGSREELDRSRGGSDPASVEQRRAVVGREGAPNSPQRAPNTPPEEGMGEVPPQLLMIFKDDLARRALVKPEAITVVSATEQQWNDGSLGCAQPGQMYTQAIVPGYRTQLQANGETYAYHADRRGHFIVCAGGQALPPVKEQMKSPPPAR